MSRIIVYSHLLPFRINHGQTRAVATATALYPFSIEKPALEKGHRAYRHGNDAHPDLEILLGHRADRSALSKISFW